MKRKFKIQKHLITTVLSLLLIIALGFSNASALITTAKQNLSSALDSYYAYISVVGNPFTTSINSNVRLNEAYKAAYDTFYSEDATDEEMQNKADDLLYALDNMYIDPKWAEETYALCLEESNENGIYSDELWQKFTTELENLNTSLIMDDEKLIDESYYKVIDIYNEMCFSYSALGDVDGNGVVNVTDVTLIQKYLSGSETLYGVQLYAASVNCRCNEISVESATNLQKNLVGDYCISTGNTSYDYNLIITPYNSATGERMQAYRNLH